MNEQGGRKLTDDALADLIMDGIAQHGEGLTIPEMETRIGLRRIPMVRGVSQGVARGSFDLTSAMRLVWDE